MSTRVLGQAARRLTADQQIPGSIPGGPFQSNFFLMCVDRARFLAAAKRAVETARASQFSEHNSRKQDLAERSMATNLPISSSGVRMRSENRTRQVGRFRTMAAQLIEEGDTESAAYLYRCADRFEQDDSDDEAPVEGLDDGAVHNLAADNELVGAFNRLAQVDDFDRGAFEGAEGILTNEGSFNMMQSVGRLNALSHDRVLDPTALDSVLDGSIDIAYAYIQNAIEPVSIELPEVYAPQGVIAPVFVNDGLFDLNNSDGSEDELPSKLRRFDLNASDSSDEDLLEVPNVGRICMLQGSSSSIHPDDNLIDHLGRAPVLAPTPSTGTRIVRRLYFRRLQSVAPRSASCSSAACSRRSARQTRRAAC